MGLCTHGPIHPWHMLGGAWIAVVHMVATGQCGVWLHPGRSSRWCLPAAPICWPNPGFPLDATWLLLWQQILVGVAPWEGSQELWPHWMAWMGQMVHWQWLSWMGQMVHLMGHVHGCPAGSMGGRGYGALGRIGLAALMGPFHGGSSPGDLTVWMPLATGEPGGTELGGNLGVKPPWLVLTGSALAACQYNAAGALTKRKINQPLRLLGGQVAMAPAGDVRYDQWILYSNVLWPGYSWQQLELEAAAGHQQLVAAGQQLGQPASSNRTKKLKEVIHCLLAFWIVWFSSMGKGWAAGLATMKTLKKKWDGTWSLALDLVVNLARFDTGSCIHWWKELKNGKALCAIHKTQRICREWDGVMGSTIGAHVQKHCALKKDSKSIVCSVSKQWYSTKCSNKQKKSSGFDGGLGGSVGASSYKHIIHTCKGPCTLIPKKDGPSPLLAGVAPTCQKHMTHTYR